MIVDGNKYIQFELDKDSGKTQVWSVVNKASCEPLMLIRWYGAWRQYVAEPDAGTIFNDTCLETIIAFLNRLNKEKRITA